MTRRARQSSASFLASLAQAGKGAAVEEALEAFVDLARARGVDEGQLREWIKSGEFKRALAHVHVTALGETIDALLVQHGAPDGVRRFVTRIAENTARRVADASFARARRPAARGAK